MKLQPSYVDWTFPGLARGGRGTSDVMFFASPLYFTLVTQGHMRVIDNNFLRRSGSVLLRTGVKIACVACSIV